MLINLINLDRCPDRLAEFKARNGHLRQIVRWSAVDGETLDPGRLVAGGLIEPGIARSYTPGALGNTFSHLYFWDEAIRRQQMVTVCEDDAIFHRDFERLAPAVLAQLPGPCDLLLWGWNFDAALVVELLPGVASCLAQFDQAELQRNAAQFQSIALSPRPLRALMHFGIVCYSIFPSGARRLKEFCLPVRDIKISLPWYRQPISNIGLDVVMNLAYPRINAFVCFPPLVITKNDRRTSLTQPRPAG